MRFAARGAIAGAALAAEPIAVGVHVAQYPAVTRRAYEIPHDLDARRFM
jgi:hypothetical protein